MMITNRSKIFTGILMLAVILIIALGGCKKQSTTPARTTTYQLKVKDQLGVSGTVTFTETSSTVTTVDIALTGGDSVYHPAHIHVNSAIETGAVAITLNPVIGGKSSTQVTTMDNSSAINYSQLIVFDGYVNVHESSSNLGLIIAQGDIGGNAITTTNKTYTLAQVGVSGVSGTALFEKRNNGNTLVSIALNGTIAGGIHPADIHIGSVATVGGGPVAKSLNDVDGTTGKSFTNIRTLDSGTPITYDNLLVYDGYLAIHQSASVSTVILCQGNIGTH